MKTYLIIIGILIITGAGFFFFLQPNTLEQDIIVVPVKVHVIETNGSYSSHRLPEDIEHIFSQNNRIWSQANIRFEISELVYDSLSNSEAAKAAEGDFGPIASLESYDWDKFNVFFIGRLGGTTNGIAFRNGYIMVADYLTVNAYRTLAHEFGHLLGLNHNALEPIRLMYSGTNGEYIPRAEIITARETAKKL